jgi:hypothetical protein
VRTRRMRIGTLALAAMAATACGSTTKFANQTRPALPVNVTVYMNGSTVSASPAQITPGPVTFIVANHAPQAESLVVEPAGAGASQPLASTPPINPGGTAQVGVQLSTHGSYTIGTATGGLRPASVQVSGQRASGANDLLTP